MTLAREEISDVNQKYTPTPTPYYRKGSWDGKLTDDNEQNQDLSASLLAPSVVLIPPL